MSEIKFREVKNFCLKWGFDVEDDDHNQMPYTLYGEMIKAARKIGGEKFVRFMRENTGTTDGFTYVEADAWEDLKVNWSHSS